MRDISDHIYHILKEKQYADPFSNEFDAEKLNSEFGNVLNEDEANIFEFLLICTVLNKDIKRNVFELFNRMKLSPDDLREFCFIAVNKYFLDLTPQMVEQVNKGVSFESEKTLFSKFTNDFDQEVNVQLAIEVGGDILSELIILSNEWNTNGGRAAHAGRRWRLQ